MSYFYDIAFTRKEELKLKKLIIGDDQSAGKAIVVENDIN
jgi:hypothetical protein